MPLAQSVSRVQVADPHVVDEPQATAPGQGIVAVGVTQVPAPSQVGGPRRFEPVHSGVPQVLPDLANAHAPLPLHDPSKPQGMVLLTAHLPCELPPAFTGRHSPLAAPVSAIAHALHVAVHAVSQQMLATQLPIAHWLFPVHPDPLVSLGVHIPPTQ